MKKSKYDAFIDGGIALFVAGAVNQILNALNIEQYSLKFQFISVVLFFSILLIIINKSKLIPNDSEKMILNYFVVFCSVSIFMILISSLMEDKYYNLWTRYYNVFSICLLSFISINCFILFILMLRYKKQNPKK